MPCYSIVNTEATWAGATGFEERDPSDHIDLGGRIVQAYIGRGHVRFRRRANLQTAWESSVQVSMLAGYTDPAITVQPDGGLVVTGHFISTDKSHVFSSYDDGRTWAKETEL